IIMYSGGYFALSMLLSDLVVRNRGSVMEHFLWISDPKLLNLRITHSSFEIIPNYDNQEESSNLFFFHNFDPPDNYIIPLDMPPNSFGIFNCTFYLASPSSSPLPPKFSFINSRATSTSGDIVFSECNFLSSQISQNVQFNFQFEFSGSRAFFKNCF